MIRARGGHILNIGSFASERVIEAPVHYAASKSALRGLTEALAREVGRYDIQVNLLAPGLLDVGPRAGAAAAPRRRVPARSARSGGWAPPRRSPRIAVFLVSDEQHAS